MIIQILSAQLDNLLLERSDCYQPGYEWERSRHYLFIYFICQLLEKYNLFNIKNSWNKNKIVSDNFTKFRLFVNSNSVRVNQQITIKSGAIKQMNIISGNDVSIFYLIMLSTCLLRYPVVEMMQLRRTESQKIKSNSSHSHSTEIRSCDRNSKIWSVIYFGPVIQTSSYFTPMRLQL